MKLGSLVVMAALVIIGCGPTSKGGPGDDDDGDPAGDSDGDGISDADEGRAENRDTDTDGMPDYLDEDSDNDTIPDYREAGDADLKTAPFDSDADGTPDFIDTDSDNNGRTDTLDGIGDVDADATLDYADVDDDNDGIFDIDEIGPIAVQAQDTDGDGTPDFRDTDSDNDTILDLYDGIADFDNDGVSNFRDTDSDGDCIPDAVEARGNPPVDNDMDTRPDFIDRDADNDGVLDRMEDKNCNGIVDTGETSPINGDTDGDGVSDLVEVVAGTNPTDPASNPQANGDFVFVEPYTKPQTPVDSDLDFKTKLQAVDMYVLLDRSGSMSQEITSVKSNLTTVVRNLTCAPAGNGVPPNCIPDLWAGAGTIGYQDNQPYQHFVDIQPSPNFAGLPTTEPLPSAFNEPLNFAALAAVTGEGGANYGIPSVAARGTCVGSPASNAGFGGFGYGCFRNNALPVVLLATDEPPISGSSTYHVPTWPGVGTQYRNRKARLVGILGSAPFTNARSDLESMAADTNAVDASMGNAPLVFDGAGATAPTAIQNGILALANGLPIDINAVSVDDPNDSVNSIAAFVDHLETLQLGTAQCANGLTDTDTNGDTFDDKYLGVRTGTPVCWKVVSKPNMTVPAIDTPQLFRASITVFGDGVTQLDQRDVFFLVPPKPVDGPIQ